MNPQLRTMIQFAQRLIFTNQMSAIALKLYRALVLRALAVIAQPMESSDSNTSYGRQWNRES